MNVAGGAAYPGFDDYYQEGGRGSNLFEIPSNNGQTLQRDARPGDPVQQPHRLPAAGHVERLRRRHDVRADRRDGLRLSAARFSSSRAWPTTKTSCSSIYRLYLARKKYAGNAPIDAMLDQVSTLLTELEVGDATELLNSAAPAGDYDADGDVDAADYLVWRNAYGTETILHGSGADGNYDGKVDAADFTIWRNSLGAGGGGGTGIDRSRAVDPRAIGIGRRGNLPARTFARVRSWKSVAGAMPNRVYTPVRAQDFRRFRCLFARNPLANFAGFCSCKACAEFVGAVPQHSMLARVDNA